ncbi:MAG: helix-turn-helix transcriptional regulator [Ruminococcaceae bacterium]|nr:helix-turn-helix transcriptional regulator [Oscillospiraceae bacterium]
MDYNLCQRISELRNRFGITQSELAKRLGVTRSSVNAWELGFATPQLKHVVEMSKIFGTTVDGILNVSPKVIVDISDLSEKEQQAVFGIVDCLKAQHDSRE